MYKVKHGKLLTRKNEKIDFNVSESVGKQSLAEARTKTVCVKPPFGDVGPGRSLCITCFVEFLRVCADAVYFASPHATSAMGIAP